MPMAHFGADTGASGFGIRTIKAAITSAVVQLTDVGPVADWQLLGTACGLSRNLWLPTAHDCGGDRIQTGLKVRIAAAFSQEQVP